MRTAACDPTETEENVVEPATAPYDSGEPVTVPTEDYVMAQLGQSDAAFTSTSRPFGNLCSGGNPCPSFAYARGLQVPFWVTQLGIYQTMLSSGGVPPETTFYATNVALTNNATYASCQDRHVCLWTNKGFKGRIFQADAPQEYEFVLNTYNFENKASSARNRFRNNFLCAYMFAAQPSRWELPAGYVTGDLGRYSNKTDSIIIDITPNTPCY